MKRVILGLYYNLPVFLQNTAISLYGIVLYFSRYSGAYKRYLQLFADRKHLNLREERRIQNKRFLRLLSYAVKNSPFYKDFYKGISLEEIKSIEDIVKLPVLSKDLLRDNIDRIYTIPNYQSLTFHTGGTTGIPVKVRKRKRDVQQRMAYLDAYKQSFGFISNKMRAARFTGRKIVEDKPEKPVFWRNNYILKQRLYSTYHLTEENLILYVKDLNRYKPQSIEGFVSAIYTVAKYMEVKGVKPEFIPKAVFTTSETVLPYHRETIERVFGCPLTDQYASNEGAPFIIQCPYGSYHEAIDTGIFEHIPAKEGTRILVTGFDTFGTPLIRYDIGDVIRESREKCLCGSVHPIIERIEGREADFITTKGGTFSQVQLSYLVSNLHTHVKQMQFQLKKDGSLIIRCQPVRSNLSRKDMGIVEKNIKEFLGQATVFRLEFTENISRTSGGKYRLIVKEDERVL